MTDSRNDPRIAACMPALQAIRGLNRRHFLQAAAALGATAGAIGTASATPPPMKFVGETEARVFQKLLDVMLPVEGSPLVPPAQIPVLQTLDAALLGTMEPHILQGLKGGIGYWNDGPKAQFGRTFVDLGNADATRFCDLWANGTEVPQRALSMGLKKLVSLAYFANPPTWGPLGYGGPTTRARKIPSLGNAPMPRT
jgi:hypothetical protein